MADLEGKRAAVIGGGSGIGLASALAVAAAGAQVVITGRTAGKLEAAARDAASSGLRIAPVAFDASDERQASAFFEAQPAFDHLVLCANAGGTIGSFVGLSTAEMRKYFDNKLWAYLNVLRHAPAKLRAGGSITLVNGAASRLAAPGMAALAVVNGGLDAIVRPLALELAPTRVNAVAPGVIDTPYWAKMGEEKRSAFYQAAANAVPLKRVGTAADIARAVVFLATSTFVTGVVLDVDGGRRLTPAMA